MIKIVIQTGHTNSNLSSLGLGSGAPGEQELTKRVGDRLSFLLRSKGFEIKQTDAIAYADQNITNNDWNLFLALHGDADYANDGGGGFATYPEPSTDGATGESQRIAQIINKVYFPETQIIYKDRANANTKYYYMWKYLTASTPCVLIEMGQVQDPHDKVLLSNTDLIANALGRAICKAFGVPFDVVTEPTTPPAPVDPTIALNKKIRDLEEEIKNLNILHQQAIAQMEIDQKEIMLNFKSGLIEELSEFIKNYQ
jgi:N-acetylmuramoyl-L-alanine amidase